jgi:hypothetical protein
MLSKVKCKFINPKTVDVFHGEEGWETWTRCRVSKKDNQFVLHPIKGVHMSQETATEVMHVCRDSLN